MKKVLSLSLLVLLTCLFVTSVSARMPQEGNAEKPTGFRGEFLLQLAEIQEKAISLADAFPQEKMVWRPMEGVRSVSEVFAHLSIANYQFLKQIKVAPPEGLSIDLEKSVTDKAKLVELMRQSFEHVRTAIMNLKDADLDKPVVLWGMETTVRGVYFQLALHMHEHLGQSIAYARMNSIVPPWTAKEMEEAAKKKGEGK